METRLSEMTGQMRGPLLVGASTTIAEFMLPRILGESLQAVLYRDAWKMPPLFAWLQQQGQIADTEMHRVFNCGIGMVVVVAADDADEAITRLSGLGETVTRIGEIVDRPAGAAQTEVR
mgnify:CR=1 FL=1